MAEIQLLPHQLSLVGGGKKQTFALREPLFAGRDTLVDSLVAGMLPRCQTASTAGHPWSFAKVKKKKKNLPGFGPVPAVPQMPCL